MTTSQQPGTVESPSCRPAAMEAAWITNDLVAWIRDVWGRHRSREVDRDEAIAILLNVQGIAIRVATFAPTEYITLPRSDGGESRRVRHRRQLFHFGILA